MRNNKTFTHKSQFNKNTNNDKDNTYFNKNTNNNKDLTHNEK